MRDDHAKVPAARRGVTLNSLKNELYSLNMRLLLAMQLHNAESQREIQEQMEEIQAEIERMCLGHL